MKAPKIPSLLKTQEIKSFNFKPRYYNPNKENRTNIQHKKKWGSSIEIIQQKKRKKAKNYKIILLIIILSLLSYKLLLI